MNLTETHPASDVARARIWVTAGSLNRDGGFEFKYVTDDDTMWCQVDAVEGGNDADVVLFLANGDEVVLDPSAAVHVREGSPQPC